MDVSAFFAGIAAARGSGAPKGIYSVCSAHPLVLKAAIETAGRYGAPVLIEATSNQVNQHGGYTGMRPADFYAFVHSLAEEAGFPASRVILGGDHLGPFAWRQKPAEEAMALSEELVRAYVLAGFTKIHLDTSMRLGGDDGSRPLTNKAIALRGARLCAAAEEAFARLREKDAGAQPPVYVIGSEVPTPGGPQDEAGRPVPTAPADFLASLSAFRAVFREKGLESALRRIVAFVVQPGVEFTGEAVFSYGSAAAAPLCRALDEAGQPMVFEGHSTDYQTPEALAAMVRDGIALLKVGPGLTFALRESLFAMEAMERELLSGTAAQLCGFSQALENAMLEDDRHWRGYYAGDAQAQRLARRYSYFDRQRYYLPQPRVAAAAARLLDNLSAVKLPETLLSQYMPEACRALRLGKISPRPQALLLAKLTEVLEGYARAAGTGPL